MIVCLVHKCTIGEECRQSGCEFWGWIFGDGVGLKPWRNKALKFGGEICWKFPEKVVGNCPKIRQTHMKDSTQIRSAEPRDQINTSSICGQSWGLQIVCATTQWLPHSHQELFSQILICNLVANLSWRFMIIRYCQKNVCPDFYFKCRHSICIFWPSWMQADSSKILGQPPV